MLDLVCFKIFWIYFLLRYVDIRNGLSFFECDDLKLFKYMYEVSGVFMDFDYLLEE